MFGVIALAQGLRYDTGSIPRSRTRRPATRTCRPSRPASRATSMPGGRCSRRSRGSRRTGSSTTSSSARSTRSSRRCSMRCGRRRPTRTRSWSSAPTTATCSAPTAACTRSGTTPTRRQPTCRSSSPARSIPGGPREIDALTSHADLIPTLLGFAGIDQAEALERVSADHSEARPLVGRDLSGLILGRDADPPSDPSCS